MRTIFALAALSCATLSLAQDSPEAPPLHPPEPKPAPKDDEDSSSSSSKVRETKTSHPPETTKSKPEPEPTTTTTSTTYSETTTSTSAEKEDEHSTISQVGASLTQPGPDPLETWVSSLTSDFVTVTTQTPGHSGHSNSTGTDAASPPVVTGGSSTVHALSAWVGVITAALVAAAF